MVRGLAPGDAHGILGPVPDFLEMVPAADGLSVGSSQGEPKGRAAFVDAAFVEVHVAYPLARGATLLAARYAPAHDPEFGKRREDDARRVSIDART
jgi:hypothetical protein